MLLQLYYYYSIPEPFSVHLLRLNLKHKLKAQAAINLLREKLLALTCLLEYKCILTFKKTLLTK